MRGASLTRRSGLKPRSIGSAKQEGYGFRSTQSLHRVRSRLVSSRTGTSTTNSFAYTGRELDAGNLYYYRARYYNPQLQRFISEDPIGINGGDNFYRYADDNPVSYVDPFGLDVTVTVWPGASGFGHVGVAVNSNDTSGFYPESHPVCLIKGCSVPGLVLDDQAKHPGITPEIIIIHTTPQQDDAMNHAINVRLQNPGKYNLYGRNCTKFVEDVLRAGGLSPLDTTYPHDLANDLRNRFPQQNNPPVNH
jgi:RHS repeat-associated protein